MADRTLRRSIGQWLIGQKEMPEYGASVVLPLFDQGQLQTNLVDFSTNVTEGFRFNDTLHSCITERANAVKIPNLCVNDRKDKELIINERHPLNRLLRYPNPWMSEDEFYERLMLHRDLSGNAYIYKRRNNAGVVAEHWVIRPDRIQIKTDPAKFIGGYYIDHLNEIAPAEDVIHLKFQDPYSEVYGIPPLMAAAYKVDISNQLNMYIKYILANMGVTTGVFSVKDRLNETVFQEFKSRMTAAFTTYAKAGKPLIVDGGVDYKRIAMGLDELTFGDLQDHVDISICSAYKVPAMLIGVMGGLERATYSNYKEAREHFYEETVQPLWQDIAGKIESSYRNERGNMRLADGQSLAFDTSNVPALQENKDKLYERQGQIAPIATVNERRAIIGLSNLGREGDVIVRPMNLIEVGSTTATGEKARQTKANRRDKIVADKMQDFIEKMETAYLPAMTRDAKKMFAFIAKRYNEAFDAAGFKAGFKPSKALSETEIDSIIGKVNDDIDKVLADMIRFEGVIKAGGELVGSLYGIDFDASVPEVEAFIDEYGFKFAQGISETSANEVRAVINKATTDGLGSYDTRRLLQSKFDDWSKTRADRVARTELIRSSNAGAKQCYRQAGVQKLQWQTTYDDRTCEYCASLNGRIVGIDDTYFNLGDELTVTGKNADGDDVDKTMTFDYEDVGQPPLHVDCRCTIIPA